ncbi:MAG: VOC family protein [Promethearchaeota archaeon]
MIKKSNFKVDHIGFVVHDLDKSVKQFSDFLGIENWTMRVIEDPVLDNATYYEQKVCHSFKFTTGCCLNGIAVELLMPIKGKNVYDDFLKEKGEGLHHICLLFSSEEGVKKAKDEFIQRGGEMIQSGRIDKRNIYYYVEKDGIVLELAYVPNS